MNNEDWPINEYREEVWEGATNDWLPKKITGTDMPKRGDIIVLWYVKTGIKKDMGLYGWGVILKFTKGEKISSIRFRPAPPSDYLKMDPLYNTDIQDLIDEIRGKPPRGTMWEINNLNADKIKAIMRKIYTG